MALSSPTEDEVVAQVRTALSGPELTALRQLLHPYLHWTCDGVTTRGRTNVLALLERTGAAPDRPPSKVELRDGQVYRWTVDGGGA